MFNCPGFSLPALVKICLAMFFYMLSPAAMAQPASQTPTDDDGKNLRLYTELAFEHSDNIFHLTDSQQSRMEADALEDSESGRFDDMESVSDNIVSPAVGIKYDTKGLGGEDLSLSGRLKYNYYTENGEKSYPELRLRLKNDIGKKGALLLEGNFLFDYFKKNYLSGYVDENDNGNIPRDERIYSSAVYDEYEGIVAYEYELYKNNKRALTQVDLRPFLGASSRLYNSPFDNRGRDVFFGGLELALEFLTRFDLGIVYQYETAKYPGDNELVLFDETGLETDVNADGEIEKNAPLVTTIDRSADRHTLGINPSFKISKDIRLNLGYEKRVSDYTSDNPLDIGHYNNSSDRTRMKAGIEYEFSKSWQAEAEYSQTDDEDDEDGDYSENCFTLSIRYNLY